MNVAHTNLVLRYFKVLEVAIMGPFPKKIEVVVGSIFINDKYFGAREYFHDRTNLMIRTPTMCIGISACVTYVASSGNATLFTCISKGQYQFVGIFCARSGQCFSRIEVAIPWSLKR